MQHTPEWQSAKAPKQKYVGYRFIAVVGNQDRNHALGEEGGTLSGLHDSWWRLCYGWCIAIIPWHRGLGLGAFDSMAWSFHVPFHGCWTQIEVLEDKFFGQIRASFEETVPHHLLQC
jgi:hypothetical protein